MYILDEIDAALDLSHSTSQHRSRFPRFCAECWSVAAAENIGRLFRTRFKGSQFIVVSLKDGLFANANVLFRTRFRDGTSIVEVRSLPSLSSSHSDVFVAQRTAQRNPGGDADKENAGSARGSLTAGGKGKGRATGSTFSTPLPER